MITAESNESLFTRYCTTADPDTFRLLFDRTAKILQRGARRMGIASSEIDDVLQETYLAALLAAERFDPSRDLVDWLWGIMCKKVADVRRGHSRHEAKLRHWRPGDPEEPTRALEGEELRRILGESVSELDSPYREVLRLRYERERSAESIARELGRSPSTVRTQISRGIAKLRRSLPAGLTPAVLATLSLPALVRGMGTDPADVGAEPITTGPAVSRPALVAAAVALLAVPALLLSFLSGSDATAATAAGAPAGPPRAETDSLDETPAPPGPTPGASAEPSRAPRVAPPERSAPRRGRVRVQLVTRLGGEPVPRVKIGLQPYPGPFAGTVRESFDVVTTATTDARGFAEFASAPTGRVRLRMSNGEASGIYDIEEDQTLVVAVDSVAIVRGIVRDWNGKPVRGAGIWTAQPTSSPAAGSFYPGTKMIHTRRDGTFRLVLVDVESTLMWAAHETGRSAMREVKLDPPELVSFELVPAPGWLRGKVRHPLGRAVPDALAVVYPAGGQPFATMAAHPTRWGGFRLRRLVPGPYSVVAITPDGSFATERVDVTEDGPTTVSLTLSGGGRIAGRAQDETGDPLAHHCVLAVPTPADYPAEKLLSRLTWTDGDGRFALPAVPPGRRVLGVIDPATGRCTAAEVAEVIATPVTAWSPVPGSGTAAVELSRHLEAVYDAVQPTPTDAPVVHFRSTGR